MSNLPSSSRKQISAFAKLSRPITISILVTGVVALTAIALKFPGRIEFRGGNQGIVFVFDGSEK
ncbi:hypothetical protein ACQ4M3_25535 [Leptolyngbya sp. AN03gr2]|uniref:hypothetical protein n=1 Tax=unclassified Leptolyngbya TaxID=2650499 RepID=UPI003D31A9EF